eukprot:scaffold20425_cov70-Phaeocystis_antarctica.AAC.6
MLCGRACGQGSGSKPAAAPPSDACGDGANHGRCRITARRAWLIASYRRAEAHMSERQAARATLRSSSAPPRPPACMPPSGGGSNSESEPPPPPRTSRDNQEAADAALGTI